MLPAEPAVVPGPEYARRVESLMRAHTDIVARFGLGAAPTFKQTLNRVIAEMEAEGSLTNRPVDSATGAGKSGL
jgi:hypothetical protein